MSKRLYLSCIVLLSITSLLAQTPGKLSLSGRLIDKQDKRPVEFASVVLYSLPDTVMITGTMSGADGEFLFKNLTAGNYLMRYSSVGYDDGIVAIDLNKDSFTFPSPILMNASMHALREVTVTADVPEKQVSVEKTRINASSNLGANTGSVLEILRSAASVNIDNDDKISIRGNNNVLILIDGLPTMIENLNNLAAANVSSIEVITSPDVKYDSEGTGGIINIISKRKSPAGLNGMISAAYGFMGMFNGTAAMNYNTSRWGFRLNYSGKIDNDIIDSDLYRYFYNTHNSINQEIYAKKKTTNNIIGGSVSYRPNERDAYSLGLKLLLPRMNNFQNFNNRYTNDTGTSDLFRQNDINFNREVFEGSLSYNHVLQPKKRELRVMMSVSSIRGHRPSFYYENHVMCQKSVSGGHPLIANGQVDYSANLWGGKIETGVKMTFRQNHIDHEFYEYDAVNSKWIYSSYFSNDLRHREYIPAIYGLYSAKAHDHFLFKLGLRAEYSVVSLLSHHENLNTSSSNLFISPQLTGTYNVNDKSSMTLGFSRRITRPTYPQLNPYTNVIDNNTYETGNIHLAPETINKIDLGYSYTDKLISVNANTYFNFSKDFITQIATIENNALILTYVNGTWDKKAGIDLSFKVKPLGWLSLALNANTYYSHTTASYDDISMINSGWVNSSNAIVNVVARKGTEFTAQYYYLTPQYFPQFTVKRIHYLNIGVKQNLMKNKLSLTATITDILNTRRWDVTSDNKLYRLINNSKNKTRMFWFGIAYNFNAYKPEPAKKANNDEDSNLIRLGQ